MKILQGRQEIDLTPDALRRDLTRYERCVIDVGTGDGRFAYRFAQANPDTLVIGLDPARADLEETSFRASRKPARGGVPNVLFVVGSVESPPVELLGAADELYVNLPWGRLLAGVLVPLPDVLAGLAALLGQGGIVRVTVNAEPWGLGLADLPNEARELPEPTVDRMLGLASSYAACGLEIDAARWLAVDEIRELHTTWVRRISHGRSHPRLLRVDVGTT